MAITKADSSNFSNAQRIMLSAMRYTNEFKAVTKALVDNIPLPKGHKNVTVNKYGTVTASALTDGADLIDSAAITNTTLTITPSEVGVKAIVTLKLVRQNIDNVYASTGRILGNAMAKKQEQDIQANFDNFSKSTPGAGQAMTLAALLGAYSYIETGGTTDEPPDDMNQTVAVLHPEQIADLVAVIQGTVGTYPVPAGISEQLVKNHMRAREPIYGIPIFSSGYLTRDSGNDAKGAVFNKRALIYVESQSIESFEEFDASLRGWENVFVADYAEGEYKDEWGVEIYSDALARI